VKVSVELMTVSVVMLVVLVVLLAEMIVAGMAGAPKICLAEV
jgi:hypothetical protein